MVLPIPILLSGCAVGHDFDLRRIMDAIRNIENSKRQNLALWDSYGIWGNALMNLFFLLILCMGYAVAKDYPTVIENAKDAPIEIIPFADGPGFTIKNVSQHAITDVRFGCVVPGTTKDKTVKVRKAMDIYPLHLENSGPGSEQIFKGYTPEHFICSQRDSTVAILEVIFKGGKKWRLPHQTIDKNYKIKGNEDCPTCIVKLLGKDRIDCATYGY
jgi:hypothetical protein